MAKIWAQIIIFLKGELKDTLLEALKTAIKAFKETLWNEIKEEVLKVLRDLLKTAEDFKNSKETKAKEEELLDKVVNKIKLPLIARPFKGLIKRVIREKLDELAQEVLNKGKAFVG